MSHVQARTARKTFRAAELIHGMIYFSPFAKEEYDKAGLAHDRMGYFASRSAAMGPVPAEVAIATFFNFAPGLVRAAIPAAWDLASPADVLAARYAAVDRSLRLAWNEGVGGPQVQEAADLARRAAERALDRPQGRPLFAGHASLPWPSEPHLVLWHALTLLREYRGDSHVALLHVEGLSGIEALVVHGATGDVPPAGLQRSRGWDDGAWADAVGSVRDRGWLEDGDELVLSEAGRRSRQTVEDRTDELARHPYEALGEEGCARLIELTTPLSAAVAAAGLGLPRSLAGRK